MGGQFSNTQWSRVLAARDGEDPNAREALESPYQTCWYPLYPFVRRQGHNAAEAEDLTPEEIYARCRALTVVERAMGRRPST